MAMKKIRTIRGTAVPYRGDDVDTDRIIPARFMKCVTFDGLGEYAFHDARQNLDAPQYKGASILISGNNFGCGSSREHAPQALAKAGFQAIIAEGYAEIFFGNSTQLGIPCVTVNHKDRQQLSERVENFPEKELLIDLENQTIQFEDKKIPFTMKEANRKALLEGAWDPLQELIANSPLVEKLEQKLKLI